MTIDSVLKAVTKRHGEGSIFMMKDAGLDVEVIPTGILPLDYALGVGGLPKGRIVEIFGQESSAKTTIALYVVAEAQKMGITPAYIDVEHALDPHWMIDVIGIDLDNILISQPDTGEDALEITEQLIQTDEVGLIVVDSVAALLPRAEAEGDFGDSHMGLHARLMSQAMRKINGRLSKSNCLLIFINQVREKVGVQFGNPEVTPGGRALKFYTTVRIETRSPNSNAIKLDTEQIGRTIKATVVKNKVAPPFRVAEFDLMYDTGVSVEQGIFQVASKQGFIGKKGGWYFDTATGENIGQGKEKTIDHLRNNPDYADELKTLILNQEGHSDGGWTAI